MGCVTINTKNGFVHFQRHFRERRGHKAIRGADKLDGRNRAFWRVRHTLGTYACPVGRTHTAAAEDCSTWIGKSSTVKVEYSTSSSEEALQFCSIEKSNVPMRPLRPHKQNRGAASCL